MEQPAIPKCATIEKRARPLAPILVVCCLILFSFITASCDTEGRKNCDWVLEPDAKYGVKTDPGMIPVCARNRTSMRQDCRLQTTVEFAKSSEGKIFRYNDLEVVSVGIPRTIKHIEFCQ